ncbi:MAG: tetratricopeptide repeat protein [Planctomycetes bacterium]|nr:tetratricopeptide repeat protein [Planctomycetota bacterium]
MRFTALLLVFAATGTGCTHNRAGTMSSLLGSDSLTGPTGGGLSTPTDTTSSELPGKQSASLCLVMAESLERADKEVDAVAYYERGRELDPAVSERVGRRLAVLYDRIDQQAKAMNEYQELLKKHPKDSSLLNDMGYSYYNRGQWAEAETYLLRSVTADKTNKRAWVNLGMAQAQLGKSTQAVVSFEKAVSRAEAQANLGFVLLTQGNRAEALAAYRRALELEPTLPIAQAAISRLEQGDSASQANP